MSNGPGIPHGSGALGIALLLISCRAAAVPCIDIFSNAVGTTGGQLQLNNSVSLSNTGGGVLGTDDLDVNNGNDKCDGGPCTASGSFIANLPLPTNTSTTDFNPLGAASFAPGDHFYNNFTLDNLDVVTLTGTGTVRIHVRGDLTIRHDATINAGGSANRLIFFVGDDVEFRNNAVAAAFIYAVDKVDFFQSSNLTGAVVGQEADLRNTASITYEAPGTADFDGFCDGTVGSGTDADGFNCIAAGADPFTGTLYLKRAANAFTFDVVALADTDSNGTMDAVETAFAASMDRDVTVELVDASGALACAARPALSPPVSQTLTFTAADAGRKAAAAMTVANAHALVGCRVTDTTPDPDVIACSTDTFTVRPSALSLAPPALNNAGASGAPLAAAGSSFSLSAVGLPGYDGTPKIDTTQVQAHAGAVAVGVLGGVFSAALPATGTATGNAFSYSEVGNFRFAAEGIYDDTFANVDRASGDCTNDFSNVAVGGRFGCNFGNTATTAWIGRFHPADFLPAVQDDGALSNACVGFTYQGEEIFATTDPVFRVTARNTAGITTQNYTGAYAKLATTDFIFGAVTGDGSQNGVDGITPITLSWSTIGSRVLTDNLDGTHDLALDGAGFTWGRVANDLVAPFTTDLDLQLIQVADADGIAAFGLPVTGSPTGVSMRYGRVALTNAHGSELQHLQVPMQVEYYLGSGIGFVVHSVDTCTVVNPLSIADLDPGDSLAVSETCVWDDDNDSGQGCSGSAPAGLEYEPAPAAGLFNLHLMAPGSGNTGVLSLIVDAPPHLEFDWSGAGDEDPRARVVFGIFNRPSSIIYRREVR